jgi:N,N'-diacetylbacillosaminyl-diphospho-undecaprenol alpha-1,3-N-acetylgalactosaminyltransferase
VSQVVHSIHFPVSARNFVEPMVAHLNQHGIEAELWFENQPGHAATIREISVPRRHLDSDLSFSPVTFLRRLSAYCRELRKAQPEVLHTHQTRASLIPLLAARLEKVPVRVYHNHGLPYLGYRGALRQLLRALELVNIRLATHVLFVSHSNLQAARGDGLLRSNQGVVLANGSAVGIDLKEFAPERFDDVASVGAQEKLGVRGSNFVLAYVGRPVERKGFRLLLRAWQRSGLGQNGGALLMAGCTNAECESALGEPVKGVKGLGYLTDLREFYAASDAVALPSDHEGFPYSLLEGAAAGRALIGTDIPGIRCAVQHQRTGLLVPARDEEALCKAIQLLRSDPVLRCRLAQDARERVEREFSRETVLRSLYQFYLSELGAGINKTKRSVLASI